MTVSRALLLWILLLLKGVALGLLIVFGPIHLAPDEAQYWTWSQALDWGYFSKPPAVAWQIASTTFFLGNTELGVRFGALLIGLAIPLVCYYLAPLNRQVAFWGALALAFSPLGFFLSFAATTDGGTVLFFLLAILILARGIAHPEGPNYYLVGLCVFFGALFKWTAFFLWPIAFAFLPLCPLMRKKSIIWGILISLLALLPSLYWNWTHDFSTFRHVFATLYRTSDRASSDGNFFDFLATQMGLMSPIFFVAFLFGIWVLCWRTEKASAPLLMLATFPLVLELYLFLAFFKKIQGNWAVYFLPPAFLIAAWFLITKKARLWLHIGLYLSIALIAFGVSIPYLQENNLIPLSYKANPFRQNMGWNKLTTVLVEAGYNPSEDFLFGDKYQVASLLSFYGPTQKRAFFFNLHRMRKNQFSYWPGPEKGKTGYFVVLENVGPEALAWYEGDYPKKLAPYFSSVEFVGAWPLFSARGKPVKYAICFRCENFNGILPSNPENYG